MKVEKGKMVYQGSKVFKPGDESPITDKSNKSGDESPITDKSNKSGAAKPVKK